MKCPGCNDPMVILELNEVEIDHCLTCKGIWLDSGEIELLLEESENKKDFFSSFSLAENCKEKTRKCPICLDKMKKILCGIEKRICIDKCKRNHGLWFDSGELEEIIKTGSFSKNNKILDQLKEIFGQKKGA